MPSATISGESGRLVRIAPAPIGSNNNGSYSRATARKISRPPMAIITTDCQVTLLIP